MNREAEIEEIMEKVKEMSIEQQEEFFVVLQILAGEAPTDTAATLRLKQKIMESQEKGEPVDEKILRYFTG